MTPLLGFVREVRVQSSLQGADLGHSLQTDLILSASGVVVPRVRVEGAELHPAHAQLRRRVALEAADVGAHLPGRSTDRQ